MKGNKLARYWMIASLTLTAAGACLGLPQQPDSVVGDPPSASSSIDVPRAKASSHATNSGWAVTSRNDLFDTTAHLIDDQKQIFSSPRKVRLSDAEWLVPLVGITSGMILTDPNLSHSLSNSPGRINTFQNLRNGGVISLGAASGGLYLWSLKTHDPHQRETGLLAGEAVIDSLIVTQSLKFIAGRERPNQDNGEGQFFQGDSSFPSSHSAAAWAAADILAHEYPGPVTKLLAYGLASTVSIASVGSKQHFASDVLIGSALGWLTSEYVYRKRHDPELGGGAWSPFIEFFRDTDSGPSKYPGSPYVPLDSWVYRAFDRLAALGYVSGDYAGVRPWSREQCAQLLLEADQAAASSVSGRSIDSQAAELLQYLHHEFAREEAAFSGPNKSLELDSVYSRVLSASGTVLNDGYHFGETFAYDYGRPFREGTNLIAGGSASATYGTLFFNFSGEFQHAPSAPALSTPVREFIADLDRSALPSAGPLAPINQFQLLGAYAGINLQGWQISIGTQSLSWGPGIGGSLLLNDNAAPFPMLRITPQNSLRIPGFSNVLGPFTLDQFFGQLEGHHGSVQPWIYGQKISLKPLRSLEFAYSRTTLIGGSGHPLNSRLFLESFFGRVDSAENSVPGDSRTAIDWTWRVPGLHDWLTFYGELEDDDDLIPLQNVTKSVLRPGLYFPRLPFLPKWDLHLEWTSSTTPGRAPFQAHGALNYWNLDYTDGYTNNGSLLGNTVGREGTSLQAWTRLWISPRHTLDFSWKKSTVLEDYIPGGGRWQDYQASYSVTKRNAFYLKIIFQFEHIASFPLLFSGSRNNVVASVELGFLPQWGRSSTLSDSPAGSSSR
jgi:Capsule assembly protein Wzi/PAP2 superfamily